jgi:hypothetical protein
MDAPDLLSAGKIGDRSRDPKHAVEASCRQPQRRGRVRKQLPAGFVGCRDTIEQLTVSFGIRPRSMTIVTVGLDLACGRDTASNLRAAFGGRR